MANPAFALSEAKTKSSICPAHMSVCLSMGAPVTAEISDTVTPFCEFFVVCVIWLGFFPCQRWNLLLPHSALDSKLCTGWLLLQPPPGQSSPSLEWVAASLCCCPWISSPFPATCSSVTPEHPTCPGKGSRICTGHRISH